MSPLNRLQIDEKSRRMADMSLAEKQLQEQIEAERLQAEEMAEARQQRMKQFNKDYRSEFYTKDTLIRNIFKVGYNTFYKR